MGKLSTTISKEIRELIPPTAFFFVSLHLVALIRALMLKGTGIDIATSASVTLGSLILGKAVLLADMLPFINRYPDKPLIYNVAWKTVIYVLVALLIHYLEELVKYWRQTGGFISGNQKLLAEISWPHFWAIQIILALLVVMYCAVHELARVLGGDQLRKMFFVAKSDG